MARQCRSAPQTPLWQSAAWAHFWLLTQGAPTGLPTLEGWAKAYLKERYAKPGNVYLGVPHRLDRPVSGVVLFARNSKAAARLAEQFQRHQVTKVYWMTLSPHHVANRGRPGLPSSLDAVRTRRPTRKSPP